MPNASEFDDIEYGEAADAVFEAAQSIANESRSAYWGMPFLDPWNSNSARARQFVAIIA